MAEPSSYSAAQVAVLLDNLTKIDALRLSDPDFRMSAFKAHLADNRYANVYPYDASLLPGTYINASVIKPLPESEEGAIACIASQAPLPSTFHTFFDHLYDQKTDVLVNLTALEENGIPKSDRYWPVDTTQPFVDATKTWSLALLSEQSATQAFDATTQPLASALPSLVVRRLRLTSLRDASKQHDFTQLHFSGWPDHGALPAPSILGLMQAVDAVARPPLKDAMPWIHCSAGIGRSGTLIGAMLLHQMPSSHLTSQPTLQLAAYVTQHMRKYRAGTVQTAGQLVALAMVIDQLRSS